MPYALGQLNGRWLHVLVAPTPYAATPTLHLVRLGAPLEAVLGRIPFQERLQKELQKPCWKQLEGLQPWSSLASLSSKTRKFCSCERPSQQNFCRLGFSRKQNFLPKVFPQTEFGTATPAGVTAIQHKSEENDGVRHPCRRGSCGRFLHLNTGHSPRAAESKHLLFVEKPAPSHSPVCSRRWRRAQSSAASGHFCRKERWTRHESRDNNLVFSCRGHFPFSRTLPCSPPG